MSVIESRLKNTSSNLQVSILLDANRGSRGEKNSRHILLPLLLYQKNCQVRIIVVQNVIFFYFTLYIVFCLILEYKTSRHPSCMFKNIFFLSGNFCDKISNLPHLPLKKFLCICTYGYEIMGNFEHPMSP